MVTHPTKPLFMVAGQRGCLQTWDLLTHHLVKTHQLPTPAPTTCMAFSHDGAILALGSSTGVVRLCKEADCDLIADFRPVKQVSTAAAVFLPSAAAYLQPLALVGGHGRHSCLQQSRTLLLCSSMCIARHAHTASACASEACSCGSTVALSIHTVSYCCATTSASMDCSPAVKVHPSHRRQPYKPKYPDIGLQCKHPALCRFPLHAQT